MSVLDHAALAALPVSGLFTHRFTQTFCLLNATMLVLLIGVGSGTASALPDANVLAYTQTLRGAEIEENHPLPTTPSVEALSPEQDANWMVNMQKDLAEREYHVNYNGQGLQAPNRAHDLRTYFTANGISIHGRSNTDSSSNNALSIGFSGLYRGESHIATVTAKALNHHENRVEIDHGLLTEWYVNTEAGLEQGFDIAEKPTGEGALRLELAIVGGQVSGSGNSLTLTALNGRKLNYRKLIVTDATGAIQTASMSAANEQSIALLVNDQNAQYPLTIDPLITSTVDTSLESDQADANLGTSVSGAGDVNGDGYADVIVGAVLYDNGESNEGAVFIYHGSTLGLSRIATTTLESDQVGARLGTSVSGAGDVNGDGYADVIVGAVLYDNGQTDEGAAFIYHGSALGISSIATALESDQFGALLGTSVSGAGDVNGDGYADVIVGARLYNNGQTNEGAAFIYHGSALGISSIAASTLESDQAFAQLGYSVSGAGDVNGDGYADVIVGAPFYDNGESNEGAAFIHHGSALGISSIAASTLESDQAFAQRGFSVSGAGDVNGDGYADVIVGAVFYDNGQIDGGAAFIYHGSALGISNIATSTLESDQAFAQLGFSVSGAGDVNSDGYADVIVGARSYNNGQVKEGAAFIYYGSASGIISKAASTLESDQAFAQLGTSVSGAGDVNGDGYADVIVAAPFYDNGQSDEGVAFIYHGGAFAISSIAASTLESGQAGALLGYSVSGAGDVNSDGYADVIVGARLYDNGQTDEGAAFIYHGSASGISSIAASTLESDQVDALLGTSVSGAGDVNGDGYADVIVGAVLYDNNGQIDEGAAFIYHGSASGISSIAASRLESNQAFAQLGFSVSGAGDVNGDGYADVIVGAVQYDNGQSDEGAAFIYHGSALGISSIAVSTLESDQAFAQLGFSVSGAGDVNGDGYADVIVGASFYANGQIYEGAAFIYRGSALGISSVAASTLESDQVGARLGFSVSGAGDVNGDGYADVIVGAIQYDNGQTDEGAAFIYHGGASGISNIAVSTLESDQAFAQLGVSVSSAGDVNGDGYADVIVGALFYDNGEMYEGAASIYHGSALGISSIAASTLESDQAFAQLGASVSDAGDVNGDGYADVIVGALFYDNGQTNEGSAFVYHGSASDISNTAALDIDNNGQADALTDGLLLIRYLFGFSGDSLITGAIGPNAQRLTANEVKNYIDNNVDQYDIDGDGITDALTDGLLVIRHLFAFTGISLTAGALSTDAHVTDPDEIAAYIDSLMP